MSDSHKVEIYSTPTCHYCQLSKEFFTEKGIEYTDYNVAEDADKRREMIEKTGQMGVPVIIIDDSQTIVGFDQGKISNLLGL